MKQNELDLLHRYLDGAITEDELQSLEELLRNSAEARATLRSLATIDAKWQQLAADEASLHSERASTAGSESAVRMQVPLWLTLTTIATALVVGAFGWVRAPQVLSTQPELGIARVIRIEGDGTTDGDGNIVDGSELFAGEEVEMQRGLIELAFRQTGVHVVATAPLKLKLDSNQRVSLHEGQVKLVVPPQGVGFVVDTAQRKFVDLGTSFVVTANATGSEVLVLDGQISVDQHDGATKDLMHEGEFAKFDRSGKIEKRSPSRISLALPELSLHATTPDDGSLRGIVLGYANSIAKDRLAKDVIGGELLPLS